MTVLPASLKTRRWLPLLVGTSLAVLGFGSGVLPAAQAGEREVNRLKLTNTCIDCDLRQADLRRVNLAGANLKGSNLERANLFRANLDGADLTGVNLNDANLGWATLQYATLNLASLESAILTYTDFTGASMYQVNLKKSYVENTLFVGAFLDESDLREMRIVSANFTDASLCGALRQFGDYRHPCDGAVTGHDPVDPY